MTPKAAGSFMECDGADYAYLRSVVLEYSSNILDESRDYLFESRLNPLLKATGHESLGSLVAALHEQPDAAIKRAIAAAMAVNETSFFRDRAPFELMRLTLFPELIRERAKSSRLRLWSAACSTGQEAYSLAMMIRESFPQLKDWEVEIAGTDLSADVITRARAGRYQRMEVNRGLPARYLLKYAQRVEDEWEIRPELKKMCRFQQRNLCSWPLLIEPFDGILLRNVMLYFPPETRRQLLVNIHRALAPDGFLILGAGEQAEMPGLFEPVQANGTFYYKPIATAS